MYACKVFPVFHLRSSIGPDATDGIIEFFKEYSRFYREHIDLYQLTVNTEKTVSISKENIEYNVTYQQSRNRYLIHLINHNYQQKILPQTDFTVSLELEGEPVAIQLLTPEGDWQQQVVYRTEQGKVVINVEKIDSYDVLVIQM